MSQFQYEYNKDSQEGLGVTKEQQSVVKCKLQQGYVKLGESKSIVNGLPVILLVKGRHTLAVNSLGFDEHYVGKVWKLK